MSTWSPGAAFAVQRDDRLQIDFGEASPLTRQTIRAATRPRSAPRRRSRAGPADDVFEAEPVSPPSPKMFLDAAGLIVQAEWTSSISGTCFGDRAGMQERPVEIGTMGLVWDGERAKPRALAPASRIASSQPPMISLPSAAK